MEVIKTGIEGVVVIEPRIFKDERGYFFESFSQREFNEKVMPVNFVQDNESMSSYGVMRGLHFQQMPYTQSKLVRCVKGAVLDVAVDIRKGSPTYGQHVAVELTEENHPQITIENIAGHIPAFKAMLDQITDRKEEVIEAAEVLIKYQGYIDRERIIAEKIHRLEAIRIKGKFDYNSLNSLSTEARQKLMKIDPETLAQASRIPGISPSDINVLLVLLGR